MGNSRTKGERKETLVAEGRDTPRPLIPAGQTMDKEREWNWRVEEKGRRQWERERRKKGIRTMGKEKKPAPIYWNEEGTKKRGDEIGNRPKTWVK